MNIEVLGRVISTLPEDDDHPYRTGPWRPQTVERRVEDCEIEGELPTDLDGIYLRNTENPVHPAIEMYHPFDGDGMVHLVGFRDGRAFYTNRFVQTDGLKAEAEAGGPLWAGIAENMNNAPRQDGWGARGNMKDASSTDVVVHNGLALTSFYQCGELYELDPLTLETLGKADWNGKFPAAGISAHPKVDDRTGEMLFFNYSNQAPYMNYGVVDENNDLVHYIDVPLPGARLPHDMAYTDNHVILNDLPLFNNPEKLAAGKYALEFHRDVPSRFAVIPRRGGTDDIMWFEADPTYVLHWTNAFEEGDEVVLDGFFQEVPIPPMIPGGSRYDNTFRLLDNVGQKTKLHRWRFDLKTGRTTEERLSDSITEFGMVNPHHLGRDYRYTYAAYSKPGWWLFDGLTRHDLHTGDETSYAFGEGVYGSETQMAPRVGSTSEDDGYLVTITTDMVRDASDCLVFDAANLADGPICRIRLPERVSFGVHSAWAPGSAIPDWRKTDHAAQAVGL